MNGLLRSAMAFVLLGASAFAVVARPDGAQAAGCGDVQPAPLEASADGTKPIASPHSDGHFTPILLVHGFLSNPTTWSQRIDFATTIDKPRADHSILGNMQRMPGALVYTVDYHKTSKRWFPKQGGGGDVFVHVADCVIADPRFEGHRMIVIAHSMGGLIARWAVTDAPGASERAKHVGLAVTVGTPYDGAWVAAIGAAIADGVAEAAKLSPALEPLLGFVHMLLTACSGVTIAECIEFNDLADFLATIHAFAPGSPELKTLSPWPTNIRVAALTSSAAVLDIGGLFNLVPDSIELGDLVVGRESATSGEHEDHVAACKYTASALRAATQDLFGGAFNFSTDPSNPRFVLGLLGACFHIHESRLLEHSTTVSGYVADQLAREVPGYAYLGDKTIGVVHGTTVTDHMTGNFSGLHYTDDGRYVVTVENAGKPSARMSALDVESGQRRDIACGACQSAIPVGGSAVAWLDQTGHVMKVDLSSSAGAQQQTYIMPTPHDTFGLDPPSLEAAQGQRLFVSEDLAMGASIEGGAVTVLTPDGKSQRIETGNVGRIVTTPTAIAYQQWFQPPSCPTGGNVGIIAGNAATATDTDIGVLGDKDRLGPMVSDLWWGRDGNLYATMSSKNCDYEDHTVTLPGLYRLDGNRWRLADAGPLRAVRKLSAQVKAVVLTNGVLYTETDGQGVEVAKGVTAIEMPPVTSDPDATIAMLAPGPSKCPDATEFRSLLQRYFNGKDVRTAGPTICEGDWAYGVTQTPIPPFGYGDGVHTLLHRIDGRWLVNQAAGTGPYFFGQDDICDMVPTKIKAELCRPFD